MLAATRLTAPKFMVKALGSVDNTYALLRDLSAELDLFAVAAAIHTPTVEEVGWMASLEI